MTTLPIRFAAIEKLQDVSLETFKARYALLQQEDPELLRIRTRPNGFQEVTGVILTHEDADCFRNLVTAFEEPVGQRSLATEATLDVVKRQTDATDLKTLQGWYLKNPLNVIQGFHRALTQWGNKTLENTCDLPQLALTDTQADLNHMRAEAKALITQKIEPPVQESVLDKTNPFRISLGNATRH